MKQISDTQISQWRKDTPGAEKAIHLNNAGAALMPVQVTDAMIQYLQLESELGGYEAAAAAAKNIEAFYTTTARIISTNQKQIAWMSSATEAYNKALSAIPFAEGDVILTSQDDYVSNQIAFLQLSRQKGIRVVHIPDLETGGIDLQAFEEQMRKYQPKLVAITHIPTNSGLIQDAVTIGQICQNFDCWYLLDACQSFGQLPLNVKAIGCDFLSATFRKFLRGPRGAGFLYCSERVLTEGLEPLFPDLHGATWTAVDEYHCRADARKFEQWEKPYALLMGSTAAMNYALEIGIEQIRDRVQYLANLIRQSLAEVPGLINLDRGENLGGICSFTLREKEGLWVKKQLDAKGIHSSLQLKEGALIDFSRKKTDWAIRLSPHYYNTEEEIGAAVEIINICCQ